MAMKFVTLVIIIEHCKKLLIKEYKIKSSVSTDKLF